VAQQTAISPKAQARRTQVEIVGIAWISCGVKFGQTARQGIALHRLPVVSCLTPAERSTLQEPVVREKCNEQFS
jgi:hypothetical protein